VATRLVLVEVPRLLADLVTDAFARDAGMALEVTAARFGLSDAISYARGGFVVASVDDPADFVAGCTRAIGAPVVLGITPDGRRAWLLELASRPLGDVTAPELVRVATEALRGRLS
jgi:hypothetical protein